MTDLLDGRAKTMLHLAPEPALERLLVPITAEKTFEDPSVTDPQERVRLFGQEDHVRR